MTKRIETLEEIREQVAGYRAARIIQTAVKLRLFEATTRFRTAEELAEELEISPRGADILGDALAALGLLVKEGDRYRNAPLAAEHLTEDAPAGITSGIRHSEQLYLRWGDLERAVRHGTVPRDQRTDVSDQSEGSQAFHQAMWEHGLRRGRIIARALAGESLHRVMDVGGGAGAQLVALAEANPDLEGLLVDQGPAIAMAGRLLPGHGLADRIRTLETDIFAPGGPLGEGFDLAILSNILHIEGPQVNRHLLERIRGSLAPGGRLLIQDFLLDDTGTHPPDAALFAVNMLVNTDRGRSWRGAEIRAWLDEAGFGPHRALAVETGSDVWLVNR